MKKENKLITVSTEQELRIIEITKERYPCFNFGSGYPCKHLICSKIFTKEHRRPSIYCTKFDVDTCPDFCKHFKPK